jgi:hypothetical protein
VAVLTIQCHEGTAAFVTPNSTQARAMASAAASSARCEHRQRRRSQRTRSCCRRPHAPAPEHERERERERVSVGFRSVIVDHPSGLIVFPYSKGAPTTALCQPAHWTTWTTWATWTTGCLAGKASRPDRTPPRRAFRRRHPHSGTRL